MTKTEDQAGNKYNGDFEELYAAFEGITSIEINAKTLRIWGESVNEFAFSKCSKTI